MTIGDGIAVASCAYAIVGLTKQLFKARAASRIATAIVAASVGALEIIRQAK